jgi:hypothetical protein
LEAVIGPPTLGPVRQADSVQRRPQEVARGIAGEHPAGSIPAMGRRRKSNDQDPRIGIAEARHRPAPVRLVSKSGDLLAGDPLAPLDKPGTEAADDHLGGQVGQPSAPSLGAVGVLYFRSSRSRRRDTIASPMRPITSR